MILRLGASITIFIFLVFVYLIWFVWSLFKVIVWDPKALNPFWDALDRHDFWACITYPWTRVSRA